MAKGVTIKFTSKKQSEKGIMSTVMGSISLISFLAANMISFRMRGDVDMRMGAAGLLSLIFALAGVVLGIMSLRESDVFRLFPRMGFCLSLLGMALWILIIMIGMS